MTQDWYCFAMSASNWVLTNEHRCLEAWGGRDLVRGVTVLDRNSVSVMSEEELLFHCPRIRMREKAGKLIIVGKR